MKVAEWLAEARETISNDTPQLCSNPCRHCESLDQAISIIERQREYTERILNNSGCVDIVVDACTEALEMEV